MKPGNSGIFTVATTHTQARYVLPSVVEQFVSKYPDVQLVLKQGNPEEICSLVDTGEADLAIGTDTLVQFPNLVRLPCFCFASLGRRQGGTPDPVGQGADPCRMS